MQICTSLQTDNHTNIPPLSFFTARMLFKLPNQQCQSTEPFSALTMLAEWQEGLPACKNWVVGCRHGYLSGARCRFAYILVDATTTHSCFNKTRIGVNFLVLDHPGSLRQRAVKQVLLFGCVNYQPGDDKASPKWAWSWSRDVTSFKFWEIS